MPPPIQRFSNPNSIDSNMQFDKSLQKIISSFGVLQCQMSSYPRLRYVLTLKNCCQSGIFSQQMQILSAAKYGVLDGNVKINIPLGPSPT